MKVVKEHFIRRKGTLQRNRNGPEQKAVGQGPLLEEKVPAKGIGAAEQKHGTGSKGKARAPSFGEEVHSEELGGAEPEELERP